MLHDELLPCLQCPISDTPLERADAALVAAANRGVAGGRLLQQNGDRVERDFCSGLVSRDWLYAVDESGAHLLPGEAIPLQQPALAIAADAIQTDAIQTDAIQTDAIQTDSEMSKNDG